jgi:hypothetical protein
METKSHPPPVPNLPALRIKALPRNLIEQSPSRPNSTQDRQSEPLAANLQQRTSDRQLFLQFLIRILVSYRLSGGPIARLKQKIFSLPGLTSDQNDPFQ